MSEHATAHQEILALLGPGGLSEDAIGKRVRLGRRLTIELQAMASMGLLHTAPGPLGRLFYGRTMAAAVAAARATFDAEVAKEKEAIRSTGKLVIRDERVQRQLGPLTVPICAPTLCRMGCGRHVPPVATICTWCAMDLKKGGEWTPGDATRGLASAGGPPATMQRGGAGTRSR
ncbi:MAG: hypothetical protein ACTHU0_21725 [Kofleriaceae bacterium]